MLPYAQRRPGVVVAIGAWDAIHPATARILGEDLDGVVSYDDRLLNAAGQAGMVTLSPHD